MLAPAKADCHTSFIAADIFLLVSSGASRPAVLAPAKAERLFPFFRRNIFNFLSFVHDADNLAFNAADISDFNTAFNTEESFAFVYSECL